MYEFGPNDTEENGIYAGDARELAKDISDNSVDLIFTDPVYNRINDYRWLAETGKRILKPGGNLIVQTGHYYLPEVIKTMDGQLDYIWVIAEKFYGTTGSLYQHKIIACWKPYLWYSKGKKRNGGWVMDWILGGGRDKRHHSWGDNTLMFINLIERLTDKGGLVFDPFAGGGSVPAACRVLGRNYLAFEIDPDTAQVARERIKTIQPRLPMDIVPEQVELFDV
jgi:DNA modification methylase